MCWKINPEIDGNSQSKKTSVFRSQLHHCLSGLHQTYKMAPASMWWKTWAATQMSHEITWIQVHNDTWNLTAFSDFLLGGVYHSIHRQRRAHICICGHSLSWCGSKSVADADTYSAVPGSPLKPNTENDIWIKTLALCNTICLLQLTPPSSTPGRSTPAVGLKVGSPVIGRFEGYLATVSSPSISQTPPP